MAANIKRNISLILAYWRSGRARSWIAVLIGPLPFLYLVSWDRGYSRFGRRGRVPRPTMPSVVIAVGRPVGRPVGGPVDRHRVIALVRRQGRLRHAGPDERGNRHLFLNQELFQPNDRQLLGIACGDQIHVSPLLEIALSQGPFGLSGEPLHELQLPALLDNLSLDQLLVGQRRQYLARRPLHAGNEFGAQLRARGLLDRDIPLVTIENRQVHRDLRSNAHDFGRIP